MKDGQGMDLTPRGTILAYPLTGVQLSEEGLTVVMRLEWEERKASGRAKPRSVQLHFPPAAALEIGRNLIRVAPAHGPKPAGKS